MLRKELVMGIAAAMVLGACANSPLHERATVASKSQSGTSGTAAAVPSPGGSASGSASGSGSASASGSTGSTGSSGSAGSTGSSASGSAAGSGTQ